MQDSLSQRLPDPVRIEAAMGTIDPRFLDSPLVQNAVLDERMDCSVLTKIETLNPIRSFKGRGTDLVLSSLLAAEATSDRARPVVVSASAGNFGQGLAFAGVSRGVDVIVYTAENANPLKIEAMRRFGARVVQEGQDFDAAKAAARAYAAQHGWPFIEDGAVAEVAEGAGTIALELTKAKARFDTILLPLGNGALVTGVGAWLRVERPDCRVIGVVAEAAPAMLLSWQKRSAVETSAAATMADGIAVRVPVPYALACMATTVDDVVSVSETALLAAMRLAHETLGLVVEPAGAAGLAALVAQPERFRGRAVATILCGGNLTVAQMRQWLCADPAL
ncbi:MAG TPA: pyridoxal-phosphate dependent enzyme [Geminicoccus sp.]|jgi:threonine dehydratase|uniref:threonine ammonia-lyase n=1 Tax=Geminicoccus sp. TaxID=2024832 RepID=UPI002E30EB7B|nr:pyridoxal-phosphate dependent enzyme [Geminicoccus sp.]HEX2526078.1 pyridoxal-phosphate dependent enzyme [Geminicoccus sp.]